MTSPFEAYQVQWPICGLASQAIATAQEARAAPGGRQVGPEGDTVPGDAVGGEGEETADRAQTGRDGDSPRP